MRILILLAYLLLMITGCHTPPTQVYSHRPSYSRMGAGITWDIYLALTLSAAERLLVQEAIRLHISSLGQYLPHPKPIWFHVRPRIFVTDTRTKYLRGAVRTGQAYKLYPGETVTISPGYKLTCSGLLLACIQLRWDDPWGSSPHPNYTGAKATQDAIVLGLEAQR